MASICDDPNGRRRIQFKGADGKRRTIRLGKISRKQAQVIKLKVEALVSASISGHTPSDETARWVRGLNDWLRDKLAAVGLVHQQDDSQLGPFIDAYIASRVDLKPATLMIFRNARSHLIRHFGADCDLRRVTRGDAEAFRHYMLNRGLAENSVRTVMKKTRHFFKVAINREMIYRNPFDKVAATVKANPKRFYYVTREEIDSVLSECHDPQWALIFALARFGGLRCPSEVFALRWQDVDWERKRILVTSPKTERNDGGGSRLTPLFPELLAYLQAAFDEAAEGEIFVVTHLRERLTATNDAIRLNLRTQAHRIIRRAGLEPWPKVFQNLRSTRETELGEQFPMHVVCKWLGNSEAVAMRHYLQVTDEHFERAVEGGPTGAKAAQKATQQSAAEPCGEVQEPPQQKPQASPDAGTCGYLQRKSFAIKYLQASPRGVEPLFSG